MVQARGEFDREQLDIDGRLRQYIRSKGGRPLFTHVRSSEDRIMVECGAGHTWSVVARKLDSERTWCPECAVDARRLGMDAADDIAAERNGRCLSTEFKNVHTKMSWECELGHQFEQTCHEITRYARWCPECKAGKPSGSGELRTFDTVLQMAKEAGGEHIGTGSALSHKTAWRCHCGYEWAETGQVMLKREYFCRACAGTAPVSIEMCQAKAKGLGGRCLSEKYVNNKTDLDWECSEGHRWSANWSNVGHGNTWCPSCSTLGGPLERAHVIADEHEGTVLTRNGRSKTAKFEFRCHAGHEFSATLHSAKRFWCRQCTSNHYGLIRLTKISTRHHGELVSTVFEGCDDAVYEWRCHSGHVFSATAGDAKASWCGRCHKLYDSQNAEEVARRHNGVFIGADLCDEDLKHWKCECGNEFSATIAIADERWCGKCLEKTEKRKKFDELRRFARFRGGRLLSKSYSGEFASYKWECDKGHVFAASHRVASRSWCGECRKHDQRCNGYQQILRIAKQRGGHLLTQTFEGKSFSYRWQCNVGHEFRISAGTYEKNGCPECRKILRRKEAYLVLQDIAISHNGRLLSPAYIDANTKYEWECDVGHRFYKIKSVAKNHWCTECSTIRQAREYAERRAQGMRRLRVIAEQNAGELLDTEFDGYSAPYEWRCQYNHRFEANYKDARHHWCPQCTSAL